LIQRSASISVSAVSGATGDAIYVGVPTQAGSSPACFAVVLQQAATNFLRPAGAMAHKWADYNLNENIGK